MNNEDRERLVRVEMGVENLTDLVTTHINTPCSPCDLHDDVESLKQTQKNARRLTWGAMLTLVGVWIREVFKNV